MKTIQSIIRFLALGIFIMLFLQSKMVIWNFVILAAIIVALFWGRLYCGWICPIKTALIPFQWLHGKVWPQEKDISFLHGPVIRYIVLAVFIGLFIVNKAGILQIPPIILLTAAAFLVVFIWGERVWHANICPIGTLLSIAAIPSPWGMKPDQSKCIYCGKCAKNCPSGAIAVNRKDKTIEINKSICLQCFECQFICPCDAMKYQNSRIAPTVASNVGDTSTHSD